MDTKNDASFKDISVATWLCWVSIANFKGVFHTVEDLWANFPRIPKAALRAFVGHFPDPFHDPSLG